MGYSIFVKYNNTANRPLFEQYGSYSSATGSKETTFKPFETDSLEELENTILALDKVYGHENLLICKVVEASYSVDVAIEEETTPDDTTNAEDNTDTESGDDTTTDTTGDEITTP